MGSMNAMGDAKGRSRPLDVIIIGGSNAGLMAGILLRRRGHNVHILEQAASDERQGLAAGIGLFRQVWQFFDTNDRLKHEPMGVRNERIFCVDADMNTISTLPLDQLMTTWDKTYYRLRANFDGYTSAYCKEPPPVDKGTNEARAIYQPGIKVHHVERGSDQRIIVSAEAVKSGTKEEFQCDIVVAADGAHSSIRRHLNPGIQREMSGYLIWRGTAPASQLSPRTLEKVEGRTTLFVGKQFYSISYSIPGDDGALEPKSRHINFAAYFWPFAPIADIMTDIDGHQHRSTIPKGKIRPEIWARQRQILRDLLPPELFDVVEHIRHPFVSVISSICSTRAAYMDNRLFLIGDALAQTQPNLGRGTDLAALGAMSLVDAIGSAGDGPLDDTKLQRWSENLTAYAKLLRARSAAFASWYMHGWTGVAYYFGRFYLTKWTHWLLGKPHDVDKAPIV